jgi:hypothetical protein
MAIACGLMPSSAMYRSDLMEAATGGCHLERPDADQILRKIRK